MILYLDLLLLFKTGSKLIRTTNKVREKKFFDVKCKRQRAIEIKETLLENNNKSLN